MLLLLAEGLKIINKLGNTLGNKLGNNYKFTGGLLVFDRVLKPRTRDARREGTGSPEKRDY